MKTLIDWLPRLIASAILLWSLTFKFTSAAESIALFDQLGVEPWGRFGTGVVELGIVALLLIPRTAWLGALCGMVVMGGAIISHILVLGINFLFMLAVTVFICCAITYLMHRRDVRFVVQD